MCGGRSLYVRGWSLHTVAGMAVMLRRREPTSPVTASPCLTDSPSQTSHARLHSNHYSTHTCIVSEEKRCLSFLLNSETFFQHAFDWQSYHFLNVNWYFFKSCISSIFVSIVYLCTALYANYDVHFTMQIPCKYLFVIYEKNTVTIQNVLFQCNCSTSFLCIS